MGRLNELAQELIAIEHNVIENGGRILAERDDLRDALVDLLDGLDSNRDERCGLTDAEWQVRIRNARKVL